VKELYKRGISGILYVTILLGTGLYTKIGFFSVLFVFSALALFEFQRMQKYLSPIPILFLGLLYYQLFTNTLHPMISSGLLYVTLAVNSYLAIRIAVKKAIPLGPIQKSGFTYFYLMSSAFFIVATHTIESTIPMGITLLMYLLIWTNNSFAYLIGKRWGKHLLLPKVSPKKNVGRVPWRCLSLPVGLYSYSTISIGLSALGISTVGPFNNKSGYSRRLN